MVRLEILLSPRLKDRVKEYSRISPMIRDAVCMGEAQPVRIQYGSSARTAPRHSRQRTLLMAILVLMASLAWGAYMISSGIVASASDGDGSGAVSSGSNAGRCAD